MIGMRMSVRRRSKAPCTSFRRSRASPPSMAVVIWWPSSSRPRLRKPRTGSSSSAKRIRAIVSGPAEQIGFGVVVGNDADEGQLPVGMTDVHAVADHEHIRTGEADEVGPDLDLPRDPFFQEDGGKDLARAAGGEKVLGEGKGAARLQDVVDEQKVAPAHLALDVAQDCHLARGDGAGAVAG